MGWDGMGWDGMGWDGMGWDGMGQDIEKGVHTCLLGQSLRPCNSSGVSNYFTPTIPVSLWSLHEY